MSPTVEELGEELASDPVSIGYWTTGISHAPLGNYTWYGNAIAVVPAGGSRTDHVSPQHTTKFRLNTVNSQGVDLTDEYQKAVTNGKFQYGDESFTINYLNIIGDQVDIDVEYDSGPNNNFLAVSTPVSMDTSAQTLYDSPTLASLGFASTEVPDPNPPEVPVPWTWDEVLEDILNNEGDLTGISWAPLEMWGSATSQQDIRKFQQTTATAHHKGEISIGTRIDLDDLVSKVEPGDGTIPGPSRWYELWEITTISLSLVNDARDYALGQAT